MIAGIIAAGFSIYPQIRLRSLRGADYNGAFATYDLDETAYAAYLQALIDGRPRRNDPFTGRDDTRAEPQPESIFSIQFATAVAASLAARVFGLTAVQAMPVISIISAFLTSLALFSLIYQITRDAWMSLAGTLTVIVGGALISGIGVFSTFSEGGEAYPYLPLLRRHIPSLSFPFLFAFLEFLYRALKSESGGRRVLFAMASAGCFGVLLFSYFYLWTSALAVFGILGLFLLVHKAESRGRDLWLIALVGASIVVLAVPYAYLLSNRNPTADAAQLLVLTHRPDLWRNIEIIGSLVAGLALLLSLKYFGWVDRLQAAFIFATGLAAFLVFNQQIITGRSLQPFHYEYYSANYIVLLSVALLFIVIVRRLLADRTLLSISFAIVLTISATGWGAFEVFETSKLWDEINIARDAAEPVNLRTRQLAQSETVDPRTVVTLNLDSLQGDSQPTVSQFAVLWARHQHTFAGIVSQDENRLRYYTLIYFSGLDAPWLREALTDCSNIEACMTLFGWDRFNSTLSANARGLTKPEIEDEVRNYAEFVASFGEREAYSPALKYVIARKDTPMSRQLAIWYDVGPAEIHGEFALSELKPRSN